jgi:flagellar FliL protein
MSTNRLILLVCVLNVLAIAAGVAVNHWLLQSALASQMAGGEGHAADEKKAEPSVEFVFLPVEKIILSLPGREREYYFVLDVVLQGPAGTDKKKLEQVVPMVRSSVAANLSTLKADELRALGFEALRQRLEEGLNADFAARNAAKPFDNLLISKLIAQ